MTVPIKAVKPSVKVGLAGLKLLVVEDVVENQVLYTIALERQGIQFELNATGRNIEASVQALGGQVDLVILDLMLPGGLSGFEIMKHEIRTNDALKDVPVLAISARDVDDIIVDLKAAGFIGLISKPLAYQRLTGQLKKIYRSYMTDESYRFIYIPPTPDA